jgi:hypothetical protein
MKDTATRRRLTDDDRNACLKLSTCGLSNQEIADIMKTSMSTVAYLKQAHTACLSKDFDTLHRLSVGHSSTVAWAMQLTGTSFPDTTTVPAVEEPVTTVEPEEKPAASAILTREYMLATFDVLSDIRSLLTEIRDILK